MTPDVPRLREQRDELRALKVIGVFDETDRKLLAILEALLSDAPPDGAAEREAELHEAAVLAAMAAVIRDDREWMLKPDLRRIVEIAIGEYVSVYGPQAIPAPTEAPAAGDPAQWTMIRQREMEAERARRLACYKRESPERSEGFESGWIAAFAHFAAAIRSHAALAARPAMTAALTAALAARGPA